MVTPDHDVVEHAHVVKQSEVLEGAADAERSPCIGRQRRDVAALVEKRAFARPVTARDAVDDRGFAGAVRPDDGEQLAALDAETDISERAHAAEPQRHAARLKAMLQRSLPEAPSKDAA